MLRQVLAVLFLTILCLLFTPIPAYATGLQDEANAVLEKIDDLNNQINNLSVEYEEALLIHETAKNKMKELQQTIEEQTVQITELQNELSNRVVAMYRNEQMTFLDVLFGSKSFHDFVTNLDMFNSINEQDNKLIQETKELRQLVIEEKTEYEEQESLSAEKMQQALLSKEEAEQLLADAQATYNNLNAEIASLVQETEERQVQVERVKQGQPATSPVTGNSIVDRAYGELGKPYVWGAAGPHSFDCSGLVSYCITGQYGMRIGTTGTFMGWTRVSDPQPGDICTNDHHCGIYIGGGQMIHAPQSGDVVKVSAVHANMIYVRY